METVALASATILALFFTAISVVASTAYAKVTTEIRSLIMQDDMNRRYLTLLAHTAATASAGLALSTMGIPGSIILAGYLVVLLCVNIFAFFPLGIRAFAFFDSSSLAEYPLRAFIRALFIVNRSGRRWLDPSFQNHANRIVENQLRILSDLIVFSIKEDRPRHDTILNIGKMVSRLARIYMEKKSEIPSESSWFTKKPKFMRWEIAASPMTTISLKTGVAPPPDLEPDHGFVEAQCREMIVQCLRHFISHNADDDAATLLVEVTKITKAYAERFEQLESMHLVGATRSVVLEHLRMTDPAAEPTKHLLQMVDLQCVAALAPILTSGLALTKRPMREPIDVAAALLRLDRRGLYAQPHPRETIRIVEDLFNRLKFERASEGAIRTQPWYVRQIIAFGYAEAIRDAIQRIAATVEAEFVAPAADLVAAKRALWAGMWLQRSLEACQKAKDRIGDLETRYAEFKKFHVTELQWPASGAELALGQIEEARVKIVHLLAKIVPDLISAPPTRTLPDLLGPVRAWLAEELIAMMERKQEEGFPKLFIGYFNASIAIAHQFIEIAQPPGRQDYLRVTMDVMLDIMDLSGLALIFSELDGTQFKRIVAGVWDSYFDRVPDKPRLVRALYGAIDSELTLPLLSPSAMQRQEWGQRLAGAMVDRGIDVDRYYGPSWPRQERKPHASAVIESIIVSFGHPLEDPHAYFAALYLTAREESKGIDYPQGVQDCIKSINRARERQAGLRDETGN